METKKPDDLKYLQLLSMKYPNINSVSSELINLSAILNLPKGTMQHVDAPPSLKVGQTMRSYGSTMAAGGSTANMVSGASRLGVTTGYIG